MNSAHIKSKLTSRLRRLRAKIGNSGLDRQEKMLARIGEIEGILNIKKTNPKG